MCNEALLSPRLRARPHRHARTSDVSVYTALSATLMATRPYAHLHVIRRRSALGGGSATRIHAGIKAGHSRHQQDSRRCGRPSHSDYEVSQRTLKASVGKSTLSKTHIGSVSSLYRRSVLFRTGKGGFKIPRYQNTYQLEPIRKFNGELVDKILINVMKNYLIGVKYHPEICMQICQKMSAEVRDQIYRKSYDRYKVIVVMSIVQKLGQGVRIDFSKLWDIERDTYSTYVIETPEFSAMGLVVGLYYE
ncbi:uncharacterized protein LOC116845723 [Odontomachus brunneus]|uniref:uncharacterized protein LOC116845723 n=1 Tax=Odontomachus brunneus TaxID=486640 RepID=UPI0013F23DC6|nr:uncharacterized protein LOC116845723 [Odontomachus brunneus]